MIIKKEFNTLYQEVDKNIKKQVEETIHRGNQLISEKGSFADD